MFPEGSHSANGEPTPPTFREALQWVATGKAFGFHVLDSEGLISFTIFEPGDEVDEGPTEGVTWIPMTQEFVAQLIKELDEDEVGVIEGSERGTFGGTSGSAAN